MSRRSRIIWFGGAGVLVLAGIGAAIAVGGTFGQVLALVLIGLGLVLATALVFYEVGLSEDRERAQEDAAAEREVKRRERVKAPRVRRSRLGRMRGEQRRLK
jgi:fatty acid desaturase